MIFNNCNLFLSDLTDLSDFLIMKTPIDWKMVYRGDHQDFLSHSLQLPHHHDRTLRAPGRLVALHNNKQSLFDASVNLV